MEIGLLIIFLLIMCVWVGRQEIAYCFAGLHVSEIFSLKTFSIYLLLAFLISVGLMMFFPYRGGNLFDQHLFDLVTGMFLTVLIINSMDMYTSVVTAFWGALCALIYFHHNSLEGFPFITMLLSWLVLPLCSIPLTYLYYRGIDHVAKKDDTHLLMRFHWIREIAFAGVILCGIAVTYNYFQLSYSLLTTFSEQMGAGENRLFVLLLLTSLVCFLAAVDRVYRGFGSAKVMNNHVAMLYSLITVIVLATIIGHVFSLLIPVVISANQMKELNNIMLDRQKQYIHWLNVGSISLLTPLTAFLLCMLMGSLMDDVYLKSATVVFIVMLSILAHLYFNQWRKHSRTKLVLSNEQQCRAEADKEVNRLDVLAVTSQFNVLSKEIDLKHRELINLSLYLRQQRDYLEDVSKRLSESARLNDIEEMRKEVTQQATELRDNIRLSAEMDQFFTQVDEMHKDFVSRLLMRCPGISEREKRLAVLLRLGYSSKEIGSMMNIETKSVEIGRYRLRKKLKLDRSENIVQYLQLL